MTPDRLAQSLGRAGLGPVIKTLTKNIMARTHPWPDGVHKILAQACPWPDPMAHWLTQ